MVQGTTRRTPRKRALESPIVVTDNNGSGRLSTSSIIIDGNSQRGIRTVSGSPIVVSHGGVVMHGGSQVIGTTQTRQRMGQQILLDGPTESRLVSREIQEYTGPRTLHQQEVVHHAGAPQVVQVRAGTVKKEKVVEVPVIHHQVKIPVEIEVPREVRVEVPVPIEVPYPVEKIVEVPEVTIQEIHVQYDVPVNVQVPTPYERIVENIIEKYIEVPGPTQVVEKLIHVPKVTQVQREVQVVRDVQVPVPVESIRENIIQENIPVEHIVHVNEEFYTERIVPYEVENIVTKIIEVPTPVERIIEQIIEIPQEVITYVDVPVPVERIVEKIIKVPQEHIVEQYEEYIVEQVEHVQKQVQVVVEKVIHRPREVIRHVHIDIPVEKLIEKIVEIPVERIVERIVEVPVERIVEVPVEHIVEKIVPSRVPWRGYAPTYVDYAPQSYVSEYGGGLVESAEVISTNDSGWREVYRSDSWKDEYDSILPPARSPGTRVEQSSYRTGPLSIPHQQGRLTTRAAGSMSALPPQGHRLSTGGRHYPHPAPGL